MKASVRWFQDAMFVGAHVGTFHAYSTKAVPNHIANLAGARRKFNQLHARIAVSEAAAWTGKRWFGGEYTIVPNGVDLDGPPAGPKPESDEFRVLFVGRPEERKGLPVLLQAFEGLVEHVPAKLTVVGAGPSGSATSPRRARSRTSRPSGGSSTTSSGAGCTRPTSCARRLFRARASG